MDGLRSRQVRAEVKDGQSARIYLRPSSKTRPLCPGRPIPDRQQRRRECHPPAGARPQELSVLRQSRRGRPRSHRILSLLFLQGGRHRHPDVVGGCAKKTPLGKGYQKAATQQLASTANYYPIVPDHYLLLAATTGYYPEVAANMRLMHFIGILSFLQVFSQLFYRHRRRSTTKSDSYSTGAAGSSP